MKNKIKLSLFVSTVVIFIGLSSQAKATTYTITDLGALGNENYGINDLSQVVSSYNGHAYIWEDGSWTTDLGTLYGGYSSGADINNSSVVAGTSSEHGFIWDEVNGMRDIGHLGIEGAVWANNINNNNQVCGTAYVGSGEDVDTHAFLWQEGVGMTDLGTLPGKSWSEGYSININGYVVGDSRGAFIWDSVNGMRNLSDLVTSNPDNLDLQMSIEINDLNQVVGDTENERAFLWDNGTVISLGVLAGDIESEARGINNSGEVIGYSWSGSGMRAYVWDSTDGMQYLLDLLESNSAGWTLLEYASDINNYGQIVGCGYIGEEMHGFLLTPSDFEGGGGDGGGDEGDGGDGGGDEGQPVPEPASLLLLGFGVVGIAAFRKRVS